MIFQKTAFGQIEFEWKYIKNAKHSWVASEQICEKTLLFNIQIDVNVKE